MDKDAAAVVELTGRILVVEDDQAIRDYLRMVLYEAGAEVVAVANGVLALAAAAEQAFDLVLMDLEMPRMDGREATRRLRTQGFVAPIVALTACDGHRFSAGAASDLGFDEVLRKPVDHRLIVGICAKWLAAERARPES